MRLDGIGNFHHEDCDNPSHSHSDAFSNHGHAADVAIMAAVRTAMNSVPGGQSVLLSTEGFADLYNLHGVRTEACPVVNTCSLATMFLTELADCADRALR